MTAQASPVTAAEPPLSERSRATGSLLITHHSSLIWLIALTIVTLLAYASSAAYPFFWVDPIDIGLARDRSLLQIFTTSQGYLYYRPFAFVLWKLLAVLQGGYQPLAFHLVHIATHLANVWLMFALAKRLFKQTLPAGIAAWLFAWYPFSYQTVTWVISPQPQATLFMLLSAILYYDGRTRPRPGGESHRDAAQRTGVRVWLSVLLLALALPFQENAASFGFVIAALEVLVIPRPPPSSPDVTGEGAKGVRWYPLLHIGVCLAFAAWWVIIPKAPDSTLARFDQATGWYLLQGLLWPVAAAVGPWRVWFAALSNPAWAPLIITAPITLIALCAAYWRGRQLPLFFFGLIWFGVMALPIWATRGFGYVGTSPRILYVAAGGSVLIWAGLLTLDFRSARFNRWWKMINGVLIATILIQSAMFLATRKTLHDQTMPAIWDVIDSGQQAGSGAKLLYVNAPDQITPKWREFPVGFFRAVLMPVSVDLGQYVELQAGVQPQTQSVSVPALAHLENYPYNVDLRGETADQTKLSAAIRAADRVFIAQYDPSGAVTITEAGRLSKQQPSQPIATFDARLQLSEAALDASNHRLTLVWDCLAPFSADETIFVHVLNASNQPVAQADGAPLHELFPLSECQPGEQIRDVRYLAVDALHPYSIKVGLYNRVTGQRLPAIDARGQELPDAATTISSQVQ